MDYNLKTTYSYFAESEKEEVGIISTIFVPSSLEEQNIKGESTVDLKLGSLSDLRQDLVNKFEDNQASFMEPFSSSAGSSKRTRTPSGGNQVVSCLVDGCRSDLSKCRDYHRRHKVCEMHSKTPRVTIRGHEQRFCQQCSRFHSLEEFDEGKRSCRKRLEGHNRRRRKPQPEPLPVNHGNFFSASQGSRILAFGNQPMVGANSVVSTTWPEAIKTERIPTPYRHSSSSLFGSYSQPYQVRQFPFLQGPESPLAGQTFHQHPNSASGCGGGGGSSSSHNENGHKMFRNEVINSDRALSLLSSSPAATPNMGIGLGRVTVIDPIPTTINPARPPISALHWEYTGTNHCQGLEEQPESLGLFSNMRTNNSLCLDVFQDEPIANESVGHHTLSFSWE